MNTIKEILCEYSFSILIFGLTALLSLIVALWIQGKRKRRYLTWKKETINLGIYKAEKEFGKDDFIEELFNENIRLETENKLLKQQLSNTKFAAIVIFIIMIFAMWLRRNKRSATESNNYDDITNVNNEMDNQNSLLEDENTVI